MSVEALDAVAEKPSRSRPVEPAAEQPVTAEEVVQTTADPAPAPAPAEPAPEPVAVV